MNSDKDLKLSHNRTRETASEALPELAIGIIEATTELALPAIGSALTTLARNYRQYKRDRAILFIKEIQRDLMRNHSIAFAVTEKIIKRMLKDFDASIPLMQAAMDDLEKEKAWAYAAIFRSFSEGFVPIERRPHFLQFVQQTPNSELLTLKEQGHNWYTPKGNRQKFYTDIKENYPVMGRNLITYGFWIEETLSFGEPITDEEAKEQGLERSPYAVLVKVLQSTEKPHH